jgi:hypothetical protein
MKMRGPWKFFNQLLSLQAVPQSKKDVTGWNLLHKLALNNALRVLCILQLLTGSRSVQGLVDILFKPLEAVFILGIFWGGGEFPLQKFQLPPPQIF